jgi:hypothetical protein
MKKYLPIICTVCSFAALLTPVNVKASHFTGVMDFEDLYPGFESEGYIPAGYQGFSWNALALWITKYRYPGSRTGYEYGTFGNASLVTGRAETVSISHDDSFSFGGCYLTSAWDSSQFVTVSGYKSGSLKYEQTVLAIRSSAIWFDFDFSDIDTLYIDPELLHVCIDNLTFGPSIIEVGVDIKPGGNENPVNLGSKGVLPVAVLTTADFDALSIDDDTLEFGDPETETGGVVNPLRTSEEDVDDDGDVDLVMHFSIPELVDADALDADSVGAVLTGLTVDDRAFIGADVVRIVPPKGKGKKK